MIPDGLISYSPMEIERLASDYLRRRVDVDSNRPPINMEVLVEHENDVGLELEMGLAHNYNVAGMVLKEPLRQTLIIKVDQGVFQGSWAEYNATLGEELSHILLHKALFLSVHSGEDFIKLQNDQQWPRFERDAKACSTAIRMPVKLVIAAAERVYPRVVDEFGFGDPILVEKHVRNRLAMEFRVATVEMWRRMNGHACNIRDRLFSSVQCKEDQLLPASWTISAAPGNSEKQQWLLD